MRLIDKLLRGKPQKDFTQPPFWELERFRTGILSDALPDQERIANDFEGFVEAIYKRNGVVFACILTRQLIFSEARFRWRELRADGPGDLLGTERLGLLEKPWPNGTTGELLARMEADLSLAGNFYATIADDQGRFGRAATGPGRRLAVMRPDRVTIMAGSASGDPHALDVQPVAYMYEPISSIVGAGSRSDAVMLQPGEVVHYSFPPDPIARWRGMSWLSPILRELQADQAASHHKLEFFRRGATLQTIVSFDASVTKEQFEQFVELWKRQHEGSDNAYRTLFVGGGADPTVVGANMAQLDFKQLQGHAETRVAMAARVHPVVLGASEGLAGSSLNAGNYAQARRNVADSWARPMWRIAAASLSTLVTPPGPGMQLWYDPRDIAFLREDRKVSAEIQSTEAQTIAALVRDGFKPESVVAAVRAEDWTLLRHMGTVSVQQQPIDPTTVNSNGNGQLEVIGSE